MKIGMIGLGIMGSRMAANLQKEGHELFVYNRDAAKAKELVDQGAVLCDSPGEVRSSSEIVFSMLADPNAVRSVATGPDGIFSAQQGADLWVDCSTVDPAFSREMAESASAIGLQFVDAPVSGSKIPAAEGQLVFLVGGSSEQVERIRPLCDLMGRKLIHAGSTGQGSALKLVVNTLLAQSFLTFTESLVMGQKMNLDRDMLLELLPQLPVVAPLMQMFAPRLKEDKGVHFPLEHLTKDIRLSLESAGEGDWPLTQICYDLLQNTLKEKGPGQDFSVVGHTFESRLKREG